MEDYVNVFWEYPISEHGVFPLDDSTMIRWRLRIPPAHAVLPCDDYDSFNFSQQLMAAAFVVENNLLCKNKGLRGLAVCNSKYATQNSSSVYTNVKADANNGSSCPSCEAWPLVVCGEGRSRWYEEFYWVYSICISLNSHRPFYWDPFARDGPVIGLWQALLPCTARILHSDLAGLPSGVPSWSEEGRWYWWSRKFQTHGRPISGFSDTLLII